MKRKISLLVVQNLREIWWEGVDWIHLAQDTDQWRAVVKALMNVGVP
jgi:hypothetical protein